MRILSIAWRNLWRTPRRTVVTLGAMVLALFVMLLYTCLAAGFLRDLEKDVVEVEYGDLQIHSAEYRDRPSLYETVQEGEVLGRLREAGYRAAPRLLAGGLAAARESSAGTAIRGIELDTDDSVSTLGTKIDRGQWLSDDDPQGVVVGRKLARVLDLDLGAELIVLSQSYDGGIANDLYTVRGVMESVSEEVDRAGLFLTAQAFRALFGLDEGAHQILVRRPETVDLEDAASQIGAMAPGLEVRTWRELVPTIASMLDTARIAILFVSSIIYIAIAIIVLNAMLMAVFERIQELGVLKALGMTPRVILALIVAEGLLQTLLAVAVGLGLGLPTIWYLSNYGIDVGTLGEVTFSGRTFSAVWYGAITPSGILSPILSLFVLVILGLIYPAFKAATIQPIQAMRHQ